MENNFENKMENLNIPNTDFVKHQETLKIGLTNASKSARIGILFIALPLLLVVLAYLKIRLLVEFNFFNNIEQFVSQDAHSDPFSWIFHLLLLGLPIVAIIINLLAITHFYIHKPNKELIITIRYRLKNLIVIIVSAIVLITVLCYILFMLK
jgi:hypothetical protein